MSNENKTALTAEEILKKHSENSAKCEVIYNKTHDAIIDAMQEFASLKTKEKDKEIERLDKGWSDKNDECFKQVESLQSTIESQQKEIEELKTSIEGVFGWREKNHHLTISEKQLKSQLSEVTKERDRIKGGYLKVLTMLNEILTPTKE